MSNHNIPDVRYRMGTLAEYEPSWNVWIMHKSLGRLTWTWIWGAEEQERRTWNVNLRSRRWWNACAIHVGCKAYISWHCLRIFSFVSSSILKYYKEWFLLDSPQLHWMIWWRWWWVERDWEIDRSSWRKIEREKYITHYVLEGLLSFIYPLGKYT